MSRLLEFEGGLSYAAAGVSIEAGDESVERMRAAVESTRRPEVLGAIGGFGGLFALSRHRDPVLVASADGVGTKLEVARQLARYDTVGRDLVAMLVDDLVCVGAEPLFVLDYVAVGRVEPARMAEVVAGVAEGCRLAGAALLGGETAEHAGVMEPDEMDLAGFAVGVIERGRELGAPRVRPGDLLIGLASPGLRSNGYSLARRVLAPPGTDLGAPAWAGASVSLAEELLRPSVIYAPSVLRAVAELGEELHAVAHITGGGIAGNVLRVLPEGLGARIELDSFATPEIFFEIQRRGRVSGAEMTRVFNCGLGMVLAVAPGAREAALALLGEHGPVVVGVVAEGSRAVELR